MDSQTRSQKGNSGYTGRLRYFYLNGDLHKAIHANRGTDQLRAWNYPKRELVVCSYSDVRKRAGKAFTTKEAAKLLNRGRLTLERAILNGDIDRPQITYSLGKDQMGEEFKYMWSEDDVMEMHAFLCTVHKGRPRNDGLVTPLNLPSAREVRARMRQDVVLYVKNKDGKFVPTFEAEQF